MDYNSLYTGESIDSVIARNRYTQEIFIDPLNGNDASSGSIKSPIQTFAQLNTLAPAAGSRIIIKNSAIIRELFAPTFSGTVDKPIIIIPYGDDYARLSCCDLATSWAKTGGQTNVYEITRAIQANGNTGGLVLENKVRLSRLASIAAVDAAAGSFYHDGTKYYIHTTGSDSPLSNGLPYEVGARNTGIDTPTTAQDLEFHGLDVYGASGDNTTYGNIECSGKRINFHNIESSLAIRHGLQYLSAEYCHTYDSKVTDIEGIALSMFTTNAADSTCVSCTVEKSEILDSNGLVTIHGVDNTDNVPTNCGVVECEMNVDNIASTIDVSAPKNHLVLYGTNGCFMEGCKVSGDSVSTANPFYIGHASAAAANVGVKIAGNQIACADFNAAVDAFFIDGRNGLNEVEFLGNYMFGNNTESAIRSFGSTGINKVNVQGNKFKDMEVAFHTDAAAEAHWSSDYNVFNGLTAQANNSVGNSRTFAQWTTETGNNDTGSVNA